MSHQHTPAHLINSAQFHRWLHRLHRQKALLRVLFFVITFAYWELMLHLILFKDWHGLLYPLLMAVFMGAVAGLITTGCRPKMNMILSWVILSVRFMLLMVYLIFWQVFICCNSFKLQPFQYENQKTIHNMPGILTYFDTIYVSSVNSLLYVKS